MPAEHAPTLYVVSDSRGQTSAAVLQAALVQFQGQRYTIVREANVRTVERVEAIVDYLAALPEAGSVVAPIESNPDAALVAAEPAGALSQEDFAWAKQTFFERCAGCHGTLRNGATGPALTPDKTQPKGTVALSALA